MLSHRAIVPWRRALLRAAMGVAAVTLLCHCSAVDDPIGPLGRAGSTDGAGGRPSASTAATGGNSPMDAQPVSTGGSAADAVANETLADATLAESAAEASETGASDAPRETSPTADASIDAPPGKVGHRVLSSVSEQGPLALLAKDGQIEWQYDVLSLGGEANDAWVLPSGNIVFAYKQGARELTPAKQMVWNYAAPSGSEVHSCQPLPEGRFLIGEAHDAGVGLLRELDAAGKVLSTVTINVPGGIPAHGQFREVRKTPQGTYLVTYLQLNQAMEFDATGKMLRTFPCGSFVAIRLPDGNTLISCGDAHRVIEVDPENKIVWQVTETEIAGNRLGFAAGLQRLANGNTVICNWPGHFATDPHQPQAFEVTRDKKLVWELNDPRLKWTSNLEVLDPEATVDGAALR